MADIVARLLLSDKYHKIWGCITQNAIQSFQAQFPEFAPTDANLCKLNGGIIVITRAQVQVHPHMSEFILHVDAFEVPNTI